MFATYLWHVYFLVSVFHFRRWIVRFIRRYLIFGSAYSVNSFQRALTNRRIVVQFSIVIDEKKNEKLKIILETQDSQSRRMEIRWNVCILGKVIFLELFLL